MTICNKNDLFKGGQAMPACTWPAEFTVSVTHRGATVSRPICSGCRSLFDVRRSSATIEIQPIDTKGHGQ